MEIKNRCELKLSTAIESGFHRLDEKYFTVPFSLLRIDARHPHDHWQQFMIRSSSPGILAGDFYDMDFKVAKDTALGLETQAYQRIYEMNKGGAAGQSVGVEVEENGFFHFVPHPLVPHKDSDFESNNTIKLKESSKLIWGEIITCGRKLYGKGEEFLYKRLMNNTEVYVDDQLIFKDKVLFEPQNEELNTLGQLEGHTHQATLFTYQSKLSQEDIYQHLVEILKDEENVEYGMSTTVANGYVIRILGNGGEQLYSIIKKIEKYIAKAIVD